MCVFLLRDEEIKEKTKDKWKSLINLENDIVKKENLAHVNRFEPRKNYWAT